MRQNKEKGGQNQAHKNQEGDKNQEGEKNQERDKNHGEKNV